MLQYALGAYCLTWITSHHVLSLPDLLCPTQIYEQIGKFQKAGNDEQRGATPAKVLTIMLLRTQTKMGHLSALRHYHVIGTNDLSHLEGNTQYPGFYLLVCTLRIGRWGL